MNNPLVSILIPVYNTEKYVAEAIESALNQTYKNIEIIIVDDGSTDKSWEIIESYRQKYPAIVKSFRQENKGACAARNKAFELSSGQYIQYLDADDLLAPDKIEHQIKYFDGSGNDDFVVNGRWRHFYGDYNENIPWGPDMEIQSDLIPLEWILKNKMSQTSCWLFPRNLVIKSNGWDENLWLNQDGEFVVRLISNASKVKFTPLSKVYYRKGNTKTITQNIRNTKKINSLFKTLQSLENILLSLEDSLRVRHFIAKKYWEFIYSFYPAERILTSEAIKKVKIYKCPKMKFENKIMEVLRIFFGYKIALWIRYLLKKDKYIVGVKE